MFSFGFLCFEKQKENKVKQKLRGLAVGPNVHVHLVSCKERK